MKNKIIESSQLPEDAKVYMKKDFLGWRIVNPIKNEDGSINWFNLLVGGKRNLVFLIILLVCISFLMYAYLHDVNEMKKVVADPCYYCPTSAFYTDMNNKKIGTGNVNLSEFVNVGVSENNAS